MVVAGNSIGGFISASMAGDYPGLVEGLVLLNSAGAQNAICTQSSTQPNLIMRRPGRGKVPASGAQCITNSCCNLPLCILFFTFLATAGKIEAGYQPPTAPTPVNAPPPFVVDAVSRVSDGNDSNGYGIMGLDE